jgi:predicted N-acetyltransferase YhbS
MKLSKLRLEEIKRIKEIDRSEIVKHIYYYRDGNFELEEEFYEIQPWSQSELRDHINHLMKLSKKGGYIYAMIDDQKLIGVIALECDFIGRKKDQLQMVFLHVDSHYRHQGIGKKLMEKAKEKARELGAKRFYISATPSLNTIRFYLALGCKLASEIDPELYELEPEDIHLELKL